MGLPPKVRAALSAAAALIALLGFIVMFGMAILDTWGAQTKPLYSDTFLYFATALAGLVGSTVAIGFNVELPTGAPTAAPAAAATAAPTSLAAANVSSLGNYLASDPRELVNFLGRNVRTIMAILYVVIYLVFGVAACIVVARKGPDITPDVLKNLASIFIGLLVLIVPAFFRGA
jgi:uncharacterized membrane protein YagU involved in acid resistance